MKDDYRAIEQGGRLSVMFSMQQMLEAFVHISPPHPSARRCCFFKWLFND